MTEGSKTFLLRRVLDPDDEEEEKDLWVGEVGGACRGCVGISCSEEGRKLGSLTGGLLPKDSIPAAVLPAPPGIPIGLVPS